MHPDHIRLRDGEGRSFLAAEQVAAGGEGSVYVLDDHAGLVAKLYHASGAKSSSAQRRMETLHAKIEYQLAHAPNAIDRGDSAARSCWAWPTAALFDESDEFVGYAMRRIDGVKGEEFIQFSSGFTWRDRTCVALELARAVRQTHEAGYVVGDLNPRNLIIAQRDAAAPGEVAGAPTLLDTDSFEVRDPATDDILYRCTVQNPEYSAPELINAFTADRSREQDYFTLAVVLFQILGLGLHPFSGGIRDGARREIKDNIARGHSVISGKHLIRPKAMVDLAVFPPRILDAFDKSLRLGHTITRARTPASEWEEALAVLLGSLTPCARNPNHHVPNHLDDCPWCAYASRLAADPFDPRLRGYTADVRQHAGPPRVIAAPGNAAAQGPRPSRVLPRHDGPSRPAIGSDTLFASMPEELKPGQAIDVEASTRASRRADTRGSGPPGPSAARPPRGGVRGTLMLLTTAIALAAIAVWLGRAGLPPASAATDRIASLWRPTDPQPRALAEGQPSAPGVLPPSLVDRGAAEQLTLKVQACIDGDQRSPYDCAQPSNSFPGINVIVQDSRTTLEPEYVRQGGTETFEFHGLPGGIYRVRIDDARVAPAFSLCPSARPEIDPAAVNLVDLEADQTLLLVYCAGTR